MHNSTNEGGKNTTTTKTLLALLAAGILVTGGALFTAPRQMAFASTDGQEGGYGVVQLLADDVNVTDDEEDDTAIVTDLGVDDTEENDSAVDDNADDDNIAPECENRFDDDPNTDEIMICTTTIDNDNNDNDNISINDSPPDTWINGVHTFKGHELVDGETTTAKRFEVDFLSTATDDFSHGGHVEFKLDNGAYIEVSRPHTFKITSTGEHTIYLRGVDINGNEDPTPATFTIIIVKQKVVVKDDLNIKHAEDDVNVKHVEDDVNVKEVQDDVKIKKADDVIIKDADNVNVNIDDKKIINTLKSKINNVEDELTDQHQDQTEQLDDIQHQINQLKKKTTNQHDDLSDQIDQLQNTVDKLVKQNKALKIQLADTEKDIKNKVEDSENDVIKQINALWDWLRDLVAAFADALGLIDEDQKKN